MNLGKVIGVVVSTQKVDSLEGVKFYVVEPQNEKGERAPCSDLLVAADTVSSGPGDCVIWVSSREAALALDETFNPVDAAIVGIVDSIDIEVQK
jgi:ethanolamine utilization protein EutN